jgi:hypothetical protein
MKAKCIWTISFVIFTMMFAIVASRNAVADIVGLWLLDDGKGDVAKDSSGRGHDGKITGCKWVDGKIEKALRFEAGNTMEVPHHDDFNVRENMTIELWANIENLPLDHVGIPGKGHDQAVGSFVFHPTKLGAKEFELRFYISIGNAWPATKSAAIPFGEWHHLAGTYDGSELKVYVDGKLAGTAAQKGKINISDGAPLKFAHDFGGRTIVGILDEICFSNVALTEDEIKRSMEGLTMAVKPSDKIATAWGKVKMARGLKG